MVTTLTHTGAVLALGAVVLFAGQYVVPGVLVPALTAAAGTIVLVFGVRPIRRCWQTSRSSNTHTHERDHGQSHGYEQHDAEPGALLTRPRPRSVAAVGVSAGTLPCPEALSMLLLAIGLNRTGLGLAMIVAFSAGPAVVLVGLGVLLVTAAPHLTRFTSPRIIRSTARVPLVSALVVTALGAALTANGISSLLH